MSKVESSLTKRSENGAEMTGASLTGSMTRSKLRLAVACPSLTTSVRPITPKKFAGGVPVNLSVCGSKVSQFGSALPPWRVAVKVSTSPSRSVAMSVGKMKSITESSAACCAGIFPMTGGSFTS
ncbi:hypothetical protein D9M70_588890 [compost metagenome]